MNSKGVSQVLSLIIAASVLMMMALTLMVALSGSIDNLTGGSDRQQCINSIRGQCGSGADVATIPSACNELDDPDSTITSAPGTADSYSGSTMSCN